MLVLVFLKPVDGLLRSPHSAAAVADSQSRMGFGDISSFKFFLKFFWSKSLKVFSRVSPPLPCPPKTDGGREGLGESTYRGLSGVESHAVRQESYDVHAE